jgi:hypothetical protein
MADEQELARLTEELEQLLCAFNERPDRCCAKGCLHCPEGRRLAWRTLSSR